MTDNLFVHSSIIALPEAPPEDFPFDGPPPDNFEVPPEAVGAGHVFKRHGAKGISGAVTKKTLRCNQISAPVLVNMIVHTMTLYSQTMDFCY